MLYVPCDYSCSTQFNDLQSIGYYVSQYIYPLPIIISQALMLMQIYFNLVANYDNHSQLLKDSRTLLQNPLNIGSRNYQVFNFRFVHFIYLLCMTKHSRGYTPPIVERISWFDYCVTLEQGWVYFNDTIKLTLIYIPLIDSELICTIA